MVEISGLSNKRFTRILPFAFVMYLIAYLDRNNIGYGFGEMGKHLHISATVEGMAGGIFFLGYFILQVPAGYYSKKLGTKLIISLSMIVWGIFAIVTGFVQNGTELLVVRFLLGMAESALFPALLVLVTEWFFNKERGRANSLWQVGAVVAGLIIGPISGYILAFSTWRMLFILEGIPAIIWAIVWLLFVPNKPEKAKFLSKQEVLFLKESLEEDKKNAKAYSNTSGNWKEVLSNKVIWALILSYFLLNMGAYGVGLWLPTVVKGLTKTGFGVVGVLVAVTAVCKIAAQVFIPRLSDKLGGRKFYTSMSIILGAVMLILSVITSKFTLISFVFLMLMGVQGGFLPLFWTLPPLFVQDSEIGYTMGLINGLGNLGGFFGPTIVGFLISLTGSTTFGLYFVSASWIVAGLIVVFLKIEKPVSIENIISKSEAMK